MANGKKAVVQNSKSRDHKKVRGHARAKATKLGAKGAAAKGQKAQGRPQAVVAKILEDRLGPLEKSRPEGWERRAYWMLVGLIHERLAANEAAMPTDELVVLAKVLAENRRADRRGADLGETLPQEGEPSGSSGGILPPNFAELVRRIYGAQLHGK